MTFEGEIDSAQLLGDVASFPLIPLGLDGVPEGISQEPAPDWLRFTYRIGTDERTVLIAKRPVRAGVSWDAIARVGATMGDQSTVKIDGVGYRQTATVTALNGESYRVRLPICGRSTMAGFSEWNLLIGGVHEGDIDFAGQRFGWISTPYSDEDLAVGFSGILSWCRERWRSDSDHRVTRGYFHVSRLHATQSGFRGERVAWRPVLELIRSDEERISSPMNQRGQVSPARDVVYVGRVPHTELFDGPGTLADRLRLDVGEYVLDGMPDWLAFEYQGTKLLVAQRPIKHSVSWDAIARVGAALGDGSVVRTTLSSHPQRAEVEDRHGNRYSVRLLRCGESTVDLDSEWNALIGGVHQGDGDFLASRDGRFGWIEESFSDEALQLGEREGAATWCAEHRIVHGRPHAVNRGYLTVSRFHLTDRRFAGDGFGWRPVLELRGQPQGWWVDSISPDDEL